MPLTDHHGSPRIFAWAALSARMLWLAARRPRRSGVTWGEQYQSFMRAFVPKAFAQHTVTGVPDRKLHLDGPLSPSAFDLLTDREAGLLN